MAQQQTGRVPLLPVYLPTFLVFEILLPHGSLCFPAELIREFEFFSSKELDCKEETDVAMVSLDLLAQCTPVSWKWSTVRSPPSRPCGGQRSNPVLSAVDFSAPPLPSPRPQQNSIEVMTTALKQLVDNQERLFEQIKSVAAVGLQAREEGWQGSYPNHIPIRLMTGPMFHSIPFYGMLEIPFGSCFSWGEYLPLSKVHVVTPCPNMHTHTHTHTHSIGILKPLQHFIENDVEQVKASRKTYEKARTEATHAADKFCQVLERFPQPCW